MSRAGFFFFLFLIHVGYLLYAEPTRPAHHLNRGESGALSGSPGAWGPHERRLAVSGGRSSEGYGVRLKEAFRSVTARRCPWC